MENKRELSMPVAVLISGILIAGSIYATGGIKVNNGGLVANTAEEIEERVIEIKEVGDNDHIFGNPDAQIKVVTYTDFECPFCKRFHYTMKQIIDEYKEEGNVAWVIRHFPLDQLHRTAREEAEATECVASLGGNDKFWAFVDKIMDNTESNDGLDMALLPKFAEEVGVSANDFKSCIDSGKMKKVVQDYLDEGVAAGARGTPYSVILNKDGNKLPIDGAMPFESVKSSIDMALNM